MKSLRLWLLILLAIALPLRNAMAAGMSCASASGHAHVAAVVADHHGHASHAGHAASHSQASHDPTASAAHGDEGKCSLCASCCAAAAPAAVGIAMPQAPPAAAAFPEHRPAPAEFFSGGPERPPRST